MTADLLERSAAKLSQLAGEGLDVATFWLECNDVLRGAVPHFTEPCWYTFDPDSLLVTSHFNPVMPEVSGAMLAHEYGEDDVWKMAEVARSGVSTTTVHEATGGKPERSAAWRNFVAAYGGDQELMVPLRDRNGTAWATLSLYRDPGRPEFSRAERAFLAKASGALAEGARRGLLIGEATDREGPQAPCLVVVDEDWRLDSMTPGTEQVLERLPGYGVDTLPTAVTSVAAQTHYAAGVLTPVARVRDAEQRWLTLHGTVMLQDGRRRVAVIIEQTDPERLAPLLMDAYGLTEREKDITRLIVRGHSTQDIAELLFIAPQTVQQHLKHIFEKTSVNSRRELVSMIFFGHYEPRLRDNERRTLTDKPIRGGPMPRQVR